MKAFRFGLDRVLEWRRLQAQIAEAELERLNRRCQQMEQQRAALLEQRSLLETTFLQSAGITGGELAALQAYRTSSRNEDARLAHSLASARQDTQRQAGLVTAKRRDARLLEKLKRKLHDGWSAEAAKEVSQLAEETYLARWKKDS